MTGTCRAACFLLALMALGGCNFFMRSWLDNPGKSQVVRVESGERIYFDLEEDATAGCRWYATSDDEDVLVKIDHRSEGGGGGSTGARGVAKVEIRIHRGYDGPSAVCFRYLRGDEAKSLKEFTLTFYKRTGDVAFWE